MSQSIFTPSSVDESRSSYLSVDSAHPFSNAFGKGVDSTQFARWYMKTGGAVSTHVRYRFDCSSIPSDATINSVTCKAKCRGSNASVTQAGNHTLGLYSGGTKIGTGTATQAFGTTAKVVDVPTGDWTREQLQECMLNIHSARGLLQTTKSQYVEFYGAELTVEYTSSSGKKFIIKSNGSWKECSKLWKKDNGVWALTDPATELNTTTKYVKGS